MIFAWIIVGLLYAAAVAGLGFGIWNARKQRRYNPMPSLIAGSVAFTLLAIIASLIGWGLL